MSSTVNYKASPEFLELVEKHKQEKAFAINEEISTLANRINDITKALPKIGKSNPFLKSYNRRPRKKQKKTLAMIKIAINTRMSESRINIIASQPIPRFPKGGIQISGPAYIGPNNTEFIQRLNGEIIPVPIPTLR